MISYLLYILTLWTAASRRKAKAASAVNARCYRSVSYREAIFNHILPLRARLDGEERGPALENVADSKDDVGAAVAEPRPVSLLVTMTVFLASARDSRVSCLLCIRSGGCFG